MRLVTVVRYRDVCARVLARMFPHGDLDVDPWTGLLWATNRVDLPGRSPQIGWRWQGPHVSAPGQKSCP